MTYAIGLFFCLELNYWTRILSLNSPILTWTASIQNLEAVVLVLQIIVYAGHHAHVLHVGGVAVAVGDGELSLCGALDLT